jgi:hypothetical protein
MTDTSAVPMDMCQDEMHEIAESEPEYLMTVVHAIMKSRDMIIPKSAVRPQTFRAAVEEQYRDLLDDPAVAMEMKILLSVLEKSDLRVYSQYGFVPRSGFRHIDVFRDGSCMFHAAVASLYTQQKGTFPSGQELKKLSSVMRSRMIFQVGCLGRRLLDIKTQTGMTIEDSLMAEYVTSAEEHKIALDVSSIICETKDSAPEGDACSTWSFISKCETWPAMIVATKLMYKSQPEAEAKTTVGKVHPLVMRLILEHNISRSTDWCGEVDLTLLSNITSLDPETPTTRFLVFQLDTANDMYVLTHTAEPSDKSVLVECTAFLLSNGQNVGIEFGSVRSGSTHFGCLLPRDLGDGTPETPVRLRTVASDRCRLFRDSVSAKAARSFKDNPVHFRCLATALEDQRRGHVCPNKVFKSGICAWHLSEFKHMVSSVPMSMVSRLAPEEMIATIKDSTAAAKNPGMTIVAALETWPFVNLTSAPSGAIVETSKQLFVVMGGLLKELKKNKSLIEVWFEADNDFSGWKAGVSVYVGNLPGVRSTRKVQAIKKITTFATSDNCTVLMSRSMVSNMSGSAVKFGSVLVMDQRIVVSADVIDGYQYVKTFVVTVGMALHEYVPTLE